jgi:cell wall protein, putative
MEFDNISQSDEDFITDPMLDYTLYDDYANKLVMEKFKNYVDAWYLNNSNRLNDIAKNKDLLLKCKKYVLENIEHEEENKSTNADYDSAEHPENTSTVIPGEFVEEPEPTEAPAIDVPTLPDGFNVDMEDLSRLSERAATPTDVINTDTLLKLEREGEDPEIPSTNNAVTTEVIPEPPVVPVFTPSRLPTEEELNTIIETSAVPEHPVTEEPTVPPPPVPPAPPVATPTESTAEPVASPVPSAPVVTPIEPATVPEVPALPGNFAVNEDELNSLSEEERAAMSAMNEE